MPDVCPECGWQEEFADRLHQTMRGRLDCLQRQAAALGPAGDELVARIDITRDWMALSLSNALPIDGGAFSDD